jgi:hypothetical protein
MSAGPIDGGFVDDDIPEQLGTFHGPLSGDTALGRLGRNATQYNDDRARAESARLDALLVRIGIQPGRRCNLSRYAPNGGGPDRSGPPPS